MTGDRGTDVLRVDRADGVAVVTLNRPEARNALNVELLRALPSTMRELDTDDDVAVVILTGADPAFCAGLDLKELGSSGANDELLPAARALAMDIVGAEQDAARALLAEYKQTSATTVTEGLEIEGRLFREWSRRAFDPAAVEGRRQAIVERGRTQTIEPVPDRP